MTNGTSHQSRNAITAVLHESKTGGRRASRDPMLSVRNLIKTRGSDDRSFTVCLPSLDLHAGDFCGLVGQSGSGKSTILDMLGLVLAPTTADRLLLRLRSGKQSKSLLLDLNSYWINEDERALSTARRQGMGYVLQTGGLFPFLTVGDNIALPARMTGRHMRRSEVEDRLREFGMCWGYSKKVSELSGGERQRVAILRALIHQPALILADEPTAAVDRDRAFAIVDMLKRYAALAGAAVLMVTHDEELLSGQANMLVRLRPAHSKADHHVKFVALADNARGGRS